MKTIKIRDTKRWLNKFYSSNFVEHPLISYDNSDIDKKIAITQNKRKSGIYRWVNKVNNKTYIGSSLDIGRRFTEYYSYNRISDEKRRYPIHIALLKYGYSNFKLEILEFCHKSDLITREQFYIDKLNPEYNVLNVAGSSLGFKHSESTKELFSKSRMGVKRSNSLDKVTFTSDEKRLNLSFTSYKAIPVTLTNVETGEILRFTSKNKAAEYLNVSQTTIKNYIINNKICKGYTICLDPIKKKNPNAGISREDKFKLC